MFGIWIGILQSNRSDNNETTLCRFLPSLFFMFIFFFDLLSVPWRKKQVTWRTRVLGWQEGGEN